MKKTALAIALMMTALTGLVSTSASATPTTSVTVTGMEYNPASTVNIVDTQGPVGENVYSGGFVTVASGTVGSFETWCVDIFQDTTFGAQINNYTRETGLAALGATNLSLLERLATESFSLVDNSLTSSAFQLAIWEIVNENVNTLSLSNGNFSANGASDGSIALANSWLSNLPSATAPVAYTINVLVSATNQDLAYFTAVPEPSTIPLLLAGLLAFVVFRRRASQKN